MVRSEEAFASPPSLPCEYVMTVMMRLAAAAAAAAADDDDDVEGSGG